MKQTLEQHKLNLANLKRTMEERKRYIDVSVASYERMMDQYNFYAHQVELAEKEGKTAFDSEKYGIGRRKNV